MISGTGGLTKSGGSTLTLSGVNTYTGSTDVIGGVLAVSGGLSDETAVFVGSGATYALGADDRVASISGSGDIALNEYRLTAGDAADTTFSGVMSGSGGLTKVGTGTLTLTGDNTYTGETEVSEGSLTVQGAGPTTATCAESGSSNICEQQNRRTQGAELEPSRSRT